MEYQTVYCSGCDRNVRVAVVHEPEAGKAVDPTAFVCLDCGSRCTGSLCPLFEITPAQMRANLERSGLAPS